MSAGIVKLRLRWMYRRDANIQRAKTDADMIQTRFGNINGELVLIKQRAQDVNMKQMGLEALEFLNIAQLARFTVKDLSDLASGKGGLPDMISLGTTLILIYYQILRLQQMAIAQQRTLLFGLTGPELAVAGLILGGVASMSTMKPRTTRRTVDRRGITRSLRAQGITG